MAALAITAGVLAGCEGPITTVRNEAKPAPAPVAPRASVANGLPLGLSGNIGVDSMSICSVGADASYNWSQPGWAAFNTYNSIPIPADPGSSGSLTVQNGGATAPAAWASNKCQVVYAYPYIGHGGGFPVVTVSARAQAGVRLDSIIKDSVRARNLSTFTGPQEIIFAAATNTNTAAGVVNNDFGSILFFYYTLLPSLQLVKLADNASVNAGQQIGFSMVVTNNGPGVANVVTLTDVLPTGSGLSWAVASPATGCSISAGTLTCSLGPLAAGANATVHVVSPTTTASCAAYSNTATAVADAQPGVQSTAQTTVACPPVLQLVKVADADSVQAGSQIGFTLTVSNAGPGVATAVTLSDPLPSGTGLAWSVSPAVSGCSISAGVLSCNFGDLAANASASVHVISPTTTLSCGTYGNTGTAQASNALAVEASATAKVRCPQSTPCPAGSFTYQMQGNGDLFITYDQFPAPNDNSYGVNAIGWPNGHRYSDLVGSDHAGFQLVDPSGVVRLSFNVDYISASTAAPSGYQSLGVNGGDGKMLVGTASGISATTSLDRNLNGVNIPGLFNASHVQQFGSVNVLLNSPPTDAAHQTYTISDPTLAGWDFHDTYFVTISAAKLASLGFDPNTWKVEPNLSQLHNSPAKPCPSTTATLSVTKYEVKDKQVKITIMNGGSTAVYLTALTLQWPAALNGKLTQIKLDGDVVYDNPDIAGGSADLTTAQLVTDQNKRKIDHNSSDVYTLIFEKNADPDLSHYAGTVTIGGIYMTVLPH